MERNLFRIAARETDIQQVLELFRREDAKLRLMGPI